MSAPPRKPLPSPPVVVTTLNAPPNKPLPSPFQKQRRATFSAPFGTTDLAHEIALVATERSQISQQRNTQNYEAETESSPPRANRRALSASFAGRSSPDVCLPFFQPKSSPSPSVSSNQETLFNAVNELYFTEKQYVKDLCVVIEV